MNQTFLEQFRQQLSIWIETRLNERRLPFQKFELCPKIITETGYLVPDMVLWINRDSQLAGSVILLPESVDEQTCSEGAAIARALGLGHFTLWAAQEITIWETSLPPSRIKTLLLPSAKQVRPDDFHQKLDELLNHLKIIVVTNAPPINNFSAHYFANLCLRNLQDLVPGLSESTRKTAGQTATNLWVEHAPLEKAWLSLWRILYLLRHDRLPSGLQPERLESTIRYALADLTKSQNSWLALQDSEPPLPEADAIRLYHLACRIRQLGWPRDKRQAMDLIELLLDEAALQFELMTPDLPWDVTLAELWVNCRPPQHTEPYSLIATRPYLAGWEFYTEDHAQDNGFLLTETLQSSPLDQPHSRVVALLDDERLPLRHDQDYRLINLRQVWPTRRFDMPRSTPIWLWDAIHLAGASATEISLILPSNWHKSCGIELLWPLLTERYQLTEATTMNSKHQALRLKTPEGKDSQILLHRSEGPIVVPTTILPQEFPKLIHFWLHADIAALQLIRDRQLTSINPAHPEQDKKLAWGIFLFCNTSLGKYLQHFFGEQTDQHDPVIIADKAVASGLPLPNEITLADLSLLGGQEEGIIPSTEVLDREFNSIFGQTPVLKHHPDHVDTATRKIQRKSKGSTVQITKAVFIDGIPVFPEHYLMNHYHPELNRYDLCGPLKIVETFFDRVMMHADGQESAFEVTGKIKAEALILASYAEATQVFLPQDDHITATITQNYCADLTRLWNNLTRECRRVEPRRQAAINLAKKIWRQQGLPPEDVFKK